MIEFKVRESTAKRGKPAWRLVQKKPVGTYIADEYQFELYTLSVMALAISRNRKRLLLWEKDGMFPKPLFELPHRNYDYSGKTYRPRFYSGDQIMNVHNLWIKKYNGLFRHLDQFLDDVRKVFYIRRILKEDELP